MDYSALPADPEGVPVICVGAHSSGGMFSPNSGTSQAELFTDFPEGLDPGIQVRITFDQPHVAFGFDSWAAGDFEGATLEVFNGAALLGTQSVPSGSGVFQGYLLTGGDTATSIRFRSTMLIVGFTGEGFAIENLSGATTVAVPGPGSLTLAALGLAGLAGYA